MTTSNDLLIKQRSVIEFLAAEGCSAANIHARMQTVYGEICISDCAVRKWSKSKGQTKEIADKVGISKERVHHIVTTVLDYRKVSARWVPRQLTVEMKAQRKDMCTQILERYNAEAEAFLQRILTGDKFWVHHYDPECKAQSMEYGHKTSPSPRKFKVVASARKVLFTVFWDMEGVVQMEFLEL
ncbi:histone-lysine N-methyltransferase SETMAR [Plakobranchus ocellatus]|uniref:Histone-lysine N-methyltransferase SETMAR n=1 Tax=Plakobranchus ocellatus TaxID=259542 RepID=A0AAV4BPN0_9GAST|nr:histone-lysine N-methyltransferase SETMAR [Plakobranchus ocellatus]